MKKICNYAFIAAVCIFMVYPVFGLISGGNIELSGVTAASEIAELNLPNLMDGTYQASLNNWWEQNFPGKPLLIKLRGQLLYSAIRQSPNVNVAMEKDNYLFQPVYIFKEFGIDKTEDLGWIAEFEKNLTALDQLCRENGKELYIFTTPNKAHFYQDKITWKYNILKKEGDNYFESFKKMLDRTGLYYFDSGKYIEEYSGQDIAAPIFYPTGTHWSSSWGIHAAAAFTEFISERSKWDLSKVFCMEAPCEKPQWPDADLYQSMNIIKEPDYPYYTAWVQVEEERDKPNVFLRGGSFMGQSLNALVAAGVFGKDVHLENSYYFTDRYSVKQELSDYTAYDEMDLDALLGETDILILEVNEANVEAMGFGFIEYVLEHPGFLKAS